MHIINQIKYIHCININLTKTTAPTTKTTESKPKLRAGNPIVAHCVVFCLTDWLTVLVSNWATQGWEKKSRRHPEPSGPTPLSGPTIRTNDQEALSLSPSLPRAQSTHKKSEIEEPMGLNPLEPTTFSSNSIVINFVLYMNIQLIVIITE